MDENTIFPKDKKVVEKTEINDMPDILPEEVEAVLSKIDPEDKKIIKKYISYSFSGPLPPPQVLEQYNHCGVQNGAERIFVMAEKQQNHRIDLESYAVKEQLRQSSKGQQYGFWISVLFLFASVLLSFYGHETVAMVLGGSTIVGLVTVFVVGKYKQNKNLNDKNIE